MQMMDNEKKQNSFCAQLCKKESKHFNQFIESTTVHGVVRVFTGKSKIRRVFWLFIVLLAFAVCLNNVIERARHLASQPTATTLSRVRQQNLSFPAVTICNLNPAKYSRVLEEILSQDETASQLQVLDYLYAYTPALCNITSSGDGSADDSYEDLNIRDILYEARHTLIFNCTFAGEDCVEDFEPVLTRLGYCYVFNSNKSNVRTTIGTGIRHGLSLVVNIEQYEYLLNRDELDAGVKIVIHSQDEPAEPDENGIGVPPGHNAFISLTKSMVEDNSGGRTSRCNEPEDTQQFNFLHEQFDYSTSACLIDCFYTNIAENCNCIDPHIEYPPQSSQFSNLSNCSTDDQLCCVLDHYDQLQVCECPVACNYFSYEKKISYSSFPGQLFATRLPKCSGATKNDCIKNYLSVNVFYETFNVKKEITEDSYSPIAFLSDVGGQLGLFIGASIISILEFLTWVLDEFKDRFIGVNDRKLKKLAKEIEQSIHVGGDEEKQPDPEAAVEEDSSSL